MGCLRNGFRRPTTGARSSDWRPRWPESGARGMGRSGRSGSSSNRPLRPRPGTPVAKRRAVSASNKPVAANLAAVFRRRQLEAFRTGRTGCPCDPHGRHGSTDVLAFLDGQTDDEKLADLLWGLIGVNWAAVEPAKPDRSDGPVPPEFGLCRLVVASAAFGPRPRRWTRLGGPSSRTGPRTPSPTPKCSTPWPPNGRTRRALRDHHGGPEVAVRWAQRHRLPEPTNDRSRLEAESRICADRLLAGMLFPVRPRPGAGGQRRPVPPEPEE